MATDAAGTTISGFDGGFRSLPLCIEDMTTEECAALLAGPVPTVILPVGSTEPHGPHLALGTDTLLARETAVRAARALRQVLVAAAVAPAVSYGVTRFADGFAGAITVSPAVLEQLVRELCVSYRRAGFALVCVTNHHLEPDHVSAVARAVEGTHATRGGVVFANQLTARWGRTLSAEFKRGDCHAGSYETSLVMAAEPAGVREEVRARLPAVPRSLAQAIREGKQTFREIGMDRAYSGTPAEATAAEGEALYEKLVAMVVTEVREALGLGGGG